jgi:hypothetical protein
VLARLLSGILTAVFLPLGVVFTVIGLTIETPDRGDPEDFVYVGLPLLAVGLVLAATFAVLMRKEAGRRRRRRAGLRTRGRVVRARLRPNVRSNGRYAMDLTVAFVPAGEATTTVFVTPFDRIDEGGEIEVMYDPAEPANYEPVLERR